MAAPGGRFTKYSFREAFDGKHWWLTQSPLEALVGLSPHSPRALLCWMLQLNKKTGWYTLCIPGGSDDKESTYNAGDLGSIPGLGRSPGGGHGNPLQYSCLENPHGHLVCQVPYGYPEHRSTSEESVAFLQTFTLCPWGVGHCVRYQWCRYE